MTVKAPRDRSALQASLLARVDRIHEWESQGRPVFVYFNNDGGKCSSERFWAKNFCGERPHSFGRIQKRSAVS